MELLWKCAAIGLASSLLGLAIGREREEQSLLLGLTAAAMILTASLGSLGGMEELLRRAGERSGLSSALTVPVLKGLGLTLLGRFAAAVCRESGRAAAASAMELATVCAVLCVSLPLLEELLELVFAYT